jgi:hypothetical protein
MAGRRVNTVASRRLERTKWSNLAGVMITVGSSTLMYINFIVYLMLGYFRNWTLNRSSWGNPTVFGFSMDAILNTMGMLLLSGIFKDIPIGVPSIASINRARFEGAISVLPAAGDFVPNSQASSIYNEDEVGLCVLPTAKLGQGVTDEGSS